MTRHTLVALATLLLSAAPARADWLLTPFFGVTFGGDAEGEHLNYGGALSWMGAGAIGFEVDGSFTPDVLDRDDGIELGVEDSNVTTLMGNLIIGVPLGAPGVRPYVSGGAGLIRTSVSSADDFFDVDDNSFGVNVGAGLIVFVRENLGLRGDLRYFRGIQDNDSSGDLDLDLGSFDFWRGTFGVTFRF